MRGVCVGGGRVYVLPRPWEAVVTKYEQDWWKVMETEEATGNCKGNRKLCGYSAGWWQEVTSATGSFRQERKLS